MEDFTIFGYGVDLEDLRQHANLTDPEEDLHYALFNNLNLSAVDDHRISVAFPENTDAFTCFINYPYIPDSKSVDPDDQSKQQMISNYIDKSLIATYYNNDFEQSPAILKSSIAKLLSKISAWASYEDYEDYC